MEPLQFLVWNFAVFARSCAEALVHPLELGRERPTRADREFRHDERLAAHHDRAPFERWLAHPAVVDSSRHRTTQITSLRLARAGLRRQVDIADDAVRSGKGVEHNFRLAETLKLGLEVEFVGDSVGQIDSDFAPGEDTLVAEAEDRDVALQ